MDYGRQVDVDVIIKHVVARAYTKLRNDLTLELANRNRSIEDKRKQLHQYFNDVRLQLTRLLALVRWLPELPSVHALVHQHGQARHCSLAFIQTADALYAASGILATARIRAFDVVNAVDVLVSGTYCRLPCLHYIWSEGRRVLRPPEAAAVAQQLTDRLRLKLLQDRLPDGVAVDRCGGGVLRLAMKHHFEAVFTLAPWAAPTAGDRLQWHLLTVKLKVAPRGVAEYALAPPQEQWLVQAVNARLSEPPAPTPAPLGDAVALLHRASLLTALDVLRQQAAALPQAVPACRVVPDAGRLVATEGRPMLSDMLCVEYWLEESKSGSQPNLYRLEVFITDQQRLVASDVPPLPDPYAGAAPRPVPVGELSAARLVAEAMERRAHCMLRALADLLRPELPEDAKVSEVEEAFDGGVRRSLQVLLGNDSERDNPWSIVVTVDPSRGRYEMRTTAVHRGEPLRSSSRRLADINLSVLSVVARLEFIAFERAATVLGSRVSYRAPAPLPAALAALSPSNTTVFLTVPGVADTCVLLVLPTPPNLNHLCLSDATVVVPQRPGCHLFRASQEGEDPADLLDLGALAAEALAQLESRGLRHYGSEERPFKRRRKDDSPGSLASEAFHGQFLAELFGRVQGLALFLSFRAHCLDWGRRQSADVAWCDSGVPPEPSLHQTHNFEAVFILPKLTGPTKLQFRIDGSPIGPSLAEVRVPSAALFADSSSPSPIDRSSEEERLPPLHATSTAVQAVKPEGDDTIVFRYDSSAGSRVFDFVLEDLRAVKAFGAVAAHCHWACAQAVGVDGQPRYTVTRRGIHAVTVAHRGPSPIHLHFFLLRDGAVGFEMDPWHPLEPDAVAVMSSALRRITASPEVGTTTLLRALQHPALAFSPDVLATHRLAQAAGALLVPLSGAAVRWVTGAGKAATLTFSAEGQVTVVAQQRREVVKVVDVPARVHELLAAL